MELLRKVKYLCECISSSVCIFISGGCFDNCFEYGERFGNFLTSKLAEGLKISIVIILSLLFAFISGSIGLHGVIGHGSRFVAEKCKVKV